MNQATIPSATQLLAIMLIFIALVNTMPSSESLLNNKLLTHVIKSRSASKKYCGNHIVQILGLLCDGQYYSPSKRNNFNMNLDTKQNTLNNGNYRSYL